MTREEQAIEYIKKYREIDEKFYNTVPKETVASIAIKKCLEFWDMAIQALSQVTEVRKLILQAERAGVHLDYGAYKFMNALEKVVGEKQIGEFEQQPCDDAISRADAIKALTGWETEPTDEEIEYTLNKLPSVTPKQKMGHWLKTGQSFLNPNKFRNFCCTECLHELEEHIRKEPKYCPNCGAKMVEPQEREDKE